jgi:hypothetical protein
VLATESWDTDNSLTFTQRWFSAGKISNEYECQTDCPVQTAQQATLHPTIDNNRMPGALYFDGGPPTT